MMFTTSDLDPRVISTSKDSMGRWCTTSYACQDKKSLTIPPTPIPLPLSPRPFPRPSSRPSHTTPTTAALSKGHVEQIGAAADVEELPPLEEDNDEGSKMEEVD